MKYGAKILCFMTSENRLWKRNKCEKTYQASAIKWPDLTIAWPSLDPHEIAQFYNYGRSDSNVLYPFPFGPSSLIDNLFAPIFHTNSNSNSNSIQGRKLPSDTAASEGKPQVSDSHLLYNYYRNP